MSACTHDFPERETAVADGYCPLCLAAGVTRLRAEVERLTKERDEACRYILDLTQGNIGCGDNPVRFLVASHAAILRERDEARAERDRLRADMATVSERTLVKGCCGHEWKEYAGTCPECRAAAEAAVERLMKERDAERDARVYLSKRVSAAESRESALREALRGVVEGNHVTHLIPGRCGLCDAARRALSDSGGKG